MSKKGMIAYALLLAFAPWKLRELPSGKRRALRREFRRELLASWLQRSAGWIRGPRDPFPKAPPASR